MEPYRSSKNSKLGTDGARGRRRPTTKTTQTMPMRPPSTSFKQHCVHQELSPTHLSTLLKAVQARRPMMRFGRIQLKFINSAMRDTIYGTDFKTLDKEWTQRKSTIRSYVAYLTTRDMKGDAPADHVHYCVVQELRDKAGVEAGALSLSAYGCGETSFLEFVDVARSALGIELAPPPGSTWERERLRARWLREHIDSELVSHISGAIDAGQFDTALKAAIGVVESRLRRRCVAVGCTAALELAGADLAVAAYHKERGCLVPPWPLAVEAAHGSQLMFQGFFLYLRNAFMHNATVMGPNDAAVYDLLATCEFLIKVIDSSAKR